MIVPGTLGLLEALADGSVPALEPRLEPRSGELGYPAAERFLRVGTDRAVRALDSLAREGVLSREFVEKAYHCPDCDSLEVRYTTVCPGCESGDTVREPIIEHFACGCVAPRERFEADDGYVCPKCRDPLDALGVDYASVGERYSCDSCEKRFDSPVERLQCRRCSRAVVPSRAPESILYRYRFDESRSEWLRSHLSARRAVSEALGCEGFEVTWDETIVGTSGVEHAVHLYATDDRRDRSLIAAIGESPTVEDVIDLSTVATDVGAYPSAIVVGEPDESVAALAERIDVGFLRSPDPAGTHLVEAVRTENA